MKNPTEELLREIYIGARSGCEAINGILPKVTDPALLRRTTAQMEMYSVLSTRAEQMMQDKQMPPPSFPLTSRLAVRGGVIMETMSASTQDELAQILCDASREGASRMRSAVYEVSREGADPEALALAQRMIIFEENAGGTL